MQRKSLTIVPQTPPPPSKPHSRLALTLKQLTLFWVVAHAETSAKAAQDLGLSTAALSGQITRLEAGAGVMLFERRTGLLPLTEAGQFLLREAEPVLARMRELEDGLLARGSAQRQVIRISGLGSVLKTLLPAAIGVIRGDIGGLQFDLHDASPQEVLSDLVQRRVALGLLPAGFAAQLPPEFMRTPVFDDPYVLAVPATIDLSVIGDPYAELDPGQLETLLAGVEFVYGHGSGAKNWLRQLLPGARIMAQCRSFDVAIGMVRAGLGICLTPSLPALTAVGVPMEGVALYRLRLAPRRIVAAHLDSYGDSEPVRALVRQLVAVGRRTPLQLTPAPQFLDRLGPRDI